MGVRVAAIVTLALLIAYHLPFLRDSPDAFVVSSTILVALVPVSALAYTFTHRPSTVVH